MLFSFIFSHLETFFVVLFLSFFFILALWDSARHFDLETQFGLLLSSQPTKRQSMSARQSRDERLSLIDRFLLIRSYGIQVSNPYSPSTVFTSLGRKGSLTGDVGADEWYNFFARFLHHGRRVTGGVPMWQAHSLLLCAVVAYAKVKSADNPWYSIKQDLLQGQTSRGNVPYTDLEIYVFVMPRFLAARPGKWVESGLQALQSPEGRTVQAVSDSSRRRERGYEGDRSRSRSCDRDRYGDKRERGHWGFA